MKRIIYILILICVFAFRLNAIELEEFIDPNPSIGNLFGQTVMVLPNGNVLITAPYTNKNGKESCGAIYLYDGKSRNLISALYGESNYDEIGNRDVSISIEDYFKIVKNKVIIPSSNWMNNKNNDSIIYAGALTIFDINYGVNGFINETNSILGTNYNQRLGIEDVIITNNHVIVINPYWDNGNLIDVGAVHFVDVERSSLEPLSSQNSLIGRKSNDKIGFYGFDILPNGNILINSPYFDNEEVEDTGAVTWIEKNKRLTGFVSKNNSIVGSYKDENLGNWNIEILSNSNYLVFSPHYDFENKIDVGAVRFCDGNYRESGIMNLTNSLIGENAADMIGHEGIKKLSETEYILVSPFYEYYDIDNYGALTFFNSNQKLTGFLNNQNSLIGTSSFSETEFKPLKLGSEYLLFTFYIKLNTEEISENNNTQRTLLLKLKIGDHPIGQLSKDNTFEINNYLPAPKIQIFKNNNFLVYSTNLDKNKEFVNYFTFCDINKSFVGEPNIKNSLIYKSKYNFLSYYNYYQQFKDSNNIYSIVTYKREKDNNGYDRTRIKSITLCDIRTGKFGNINETNSLMMNDKYSYFSISIIYNDNNESLLYINFEDISNNIRVYQFITFNHNILPKGYLSEKNSIIYNIPISDESISFSGNALNIKLKNNVNLFSFQFYNNYPNYEEFNKYIIIDKNTKFGVYDEKKVISTNINLSPYDLPFKFINEDYIVNPFYRIIQNSFGDLFLFDIEKNTDTNTENLYLKCFSTDSENENKLISKIKLSNRSLDLNYLLLKNSKLLIGSNNTLEENQNTKHLSYLTVIDLDKKLGTEINESNSIIFSDTSNKKISYNNYLIRLDSNKFVYQFFNKDKVNKVFEAYKIIDLNFGVDNNIDTTNTLINFNLSKFSIPSVVRMNDEYLLSINRDYDTTKIYEGLFFKENLSGLYENKSKISFKNNLIEKTYIESSYESTRYSILFKILNSQELPFYVINQDNYWDFYWNYPNTNWRNGNWYNGYMLKNGNIIYTDMNNISMHFFKKLNTVTQSISELDADYLMESDNRNFTHLINNKHKYKSSEVVLNINNIYYYINGYSPLPFIEMKYISIVPYFDSYRPILLPFSNSMGFDGVPDSLDNLLPQNNFKYPTLVFNIDSKTDYLYISILNNGGDNNSKVYRIKDKEYEVNIRTKSIDSITTNSVKISGHIKSDGGAEVTEKGFVISKSPSPTINDIKIKNTESQLLFINVILNLEPKTKYFVRAYAKNKVGLSYGEELSFETLGDETSVENEYDTSLIFPNPSSDKISVDLGGIVVADLVVYDILGNEIMSIPNYTNKSDIDISILSIGTYTIQIQTSTGSIRQKLLVSR